MIRNFENGDIATSGVQFKTGPQAVAQSIYHRLRMFLGEYFLDVTDGTPWFQSVLGKAPQDVAEMVIKERIMGAPGVVGIAGFQFDSNAPERRLSISASVIDADGAAVAIALDEDII